MDLDFSKKTLEEFKKHYLELKVNNPNMECQIITKDGCHVTHMEPYNPLIAIYYFDENGKEGVEFIHYSSFDISVKFTEDME